MTVLTLRKAAELLGISDDTIRRWADAGRFSTTTTTGGHLGVAGAELARLAVQLHAGDRPDSPNPRSARNRLPGIVTRVVRDAVMAQVELQCGPHRVVSLISREAADDLALEPGVLATASVKATNVVIEHAPDSA